MSLETAIQNLADAINAHAEAVRFSGGMTGASAAVTALAAAAQSDEPKRGRGRPPGKKVEPEVEAPAAEEAPAVQSAAAKVAARIAAVSAEAKPAAAEITKQMVQNTLIEVVKKHGRDECGKLCRAHGGPNLSALDPSVYPAIYADAVETLARDAA